MIKARHTMLATSLALGLTAAVTSGAAEALPADRGAWGTWQKLLQLQTTASALHTTAHPDDEHGGVLTWLSRGQGARVALMTLNRGESGANAIGPELFDGLGLIRTEELLVADRYYGVDDQYFTTVLDYGYSKRLEEALDKWGKENVQRDVVRVIRMNRPLVVISRFQGNRRDGHGNHQTAGLVTQEAFAMAGDPNAFPEQIAEGLRPWQPLKLYRGGVRENETWHVRTNTGVYSPWLGTSYQNFSNLGLSFQRSQVSGRRRVSVGDVISFYERLKSHVDAPDKEETFFDGIDTSLTGLFETLGRPEPAGAQAALAAIQAEVDAAVGAFSLEKPLASVPALARGLAATRAAIAQLANEPDAVFVLEVKQEQFQDAISTALGLTLDAKARPGGYEDPPSRFGRAPAPPTLEPVTPGQSFDLRATLVNPSAVEIGLDDLAVEAGDGWEIVASGEAPPEAVGNNEVVTRDFSVTLSEDAPLSRPFFGRDDVQQPRYDLADPSEFGRPHQKPAAVAVARYRVGDVPIEVRSVVTRDEARLPYGHETRELMVLPEIGVRLTPPSAIIPVAASEKRVVLQVELVNGWHGEIDGELKLDLPSGWISEPPAHPFRFSRPGERANYSFDVSVPSLEDRSYEVHAVARARGKEFSEGYDVIEYRDYETRYLYHSARSEVRGIDVKVLPGLRLGYVMGVGDKVPEGIEQLGVRVDLLDSGALASADLSGYDAVMTGTRAYAVRPDLHTYNRRLLDYAKGGGNLIVLYNTQEMVPNDVSPFPALLPRRAEEVSEEDSPVTILAPDHQALSWPNAITLGDFDGWVEQRGSKWWSEWDPAYTAMLETHDIGQEPQSGGWLTACYGKGTYSYFAYAIHRQLPYGVAGAYRLVANLLALGKAPPSGSGEQ